MLDHITLETGPDPRGTVIWLHGLGADAHDFEPIVPMLPLDVPLRFVFPNAPERPVTINGGMRMRAWYDIDPADPGSGDADIRESAAALEALMAQELARGLNSRQLVLAGFSQGGVIALHTALRYETPLAGLMALSTYVHDHEHLADAVTLANVDIPIFMAHGTADPMIPIARAVTGREALTALNYQVSWHQYAMGHQVCPEEIDDIGAWLNQCFAGAGA